MLITILITALELGWAQQSTMSARYAVVVGNGHYTELSTLRNPENDATDMATALQGLGFEVTLLVDADLVQMEEAVTRLETRLSGSPSSIGFFYYAGHGVQSNGINYLIPTDAHIVSEGYLKTKALAAQSVLDVLQEAGNSLNVVVLDACRDNPFGWARSGTRGLSVVGSQPPGSIVVYATSAGSTAQDGSGRNGVFTAELLKNIKAPGVEIKEVFNRTGAGVLEVTLGKQIPAVYSQFFGNAYLAGAEISGSVAARQSESTPSGQQALSAAPPNQPPSPQAAGKTAQLAITANLIGAEVYVDGVNFGNTPNFLSGIQAKKDITVEVRLSNYLISKKTVTLEPGETRELYFELERDRGNLYIIVKDPESYTLFIDGWYRGKLSASGMVNNVDAGKIDVELIGDGLYWKNQVQVKPGNEITTVTVSPWKDEFKAPKHIEFVIIQGGTFMMGSDAGNYDESPTHRVTISSFMLSKYEVSQEQYRNVTGINPSKFVEGGIASGIATRRPVEQVSWYDAVSFCNKLSDIDGLQKVYTISSNNVMADFSKNGYRLPTEAEWEYAATGGMQSQGYTYAGSNDPNTVALYNGNTNKITYTVGTMNPNELGIYDMSGNVSEWCWDWYGPYSTSPQIDPVGISSATNRVIRGGSWILGTSNLRSCDRDFDNPMERNSYLGFRVARRLQE